MGKREIENMKEKMKRFYMNMNVQYVKPLINCSGYLRLLSHLVASVAYPSGWDSRVEGVR